MAETITHLSTIDLALDRLERADDSEAKRVARRRVEREIQKLVRTLTPE